MSHYACPSCDGPTSVVETRRSKKGLRRRRRCGNNHRFTTVELPHDTGKRVAGLINWLTRQGLDEDLADYAKIEIKAIMSGLPPEQDDDEDEPSTPIHSPFGPDEGHCHSPGARIIEGLQEALGLCRSYQAPEASQADLAPTPCSPDRRVDCPVGGTAGDPEGN